MSGLNFSAGIDTSQWKKDVDEMRRDILNFSNNTLAELSSKLRQIFSSDTFSAENLEKAVGGITESWMEMGTVGEKEFEKINRLMADIMDKQFELSENPPKDPLSLGVAQYDLKKAQDELLNFVEGVRVSNKEIENLRESLQADIKKNFFSDTGEVMLADLKNARDQARRIYNELVKDRDDLRKRLDKMPSSGAKNSLSAELRGINTEIAKSKVRMDEYGKAYDSVQSKGQSLHSRINQLKISMLQLDTTTASGAKRYMELSKELSEAQLEMRKLNEQTRIMSRGGVGLQAVVGGFRALSGGMTMATGLMTLFNSESENMEKQMVRLQSLMSVSIGVEQLANTVRKDGSLITSISVLQIRAKARAEELATKGTVRATIAQRALNLVAKANPYVLLATAILSVVGAYALFSSKTKEAREEQEKMNKAVTDDVAGNMVSFELLKAKWKEAGDSLDQKKEVVKKFNDELGDSVGTIDSLSKAEDIFTGEGTIRFVEALKLRAEAQYLSNKATEDYAEVAKAREKMEANLLQAGSKSFGDKIATWSKGIWASMTGNMDQFGILALDKQEKAYDATIDKLLEKQKETAKLFDSLGLNRDKNSDKDAKKARELTLKQQLDAKQKMWEDYYKAIEILGTESADKIFSDEINVDSNFLEYVRSLRDELKELESPTMKQVEAMVMYDDVIADLTDRESPFEKQMKEIRDDASQIDILIDRLEYLKAVQDNLGDTLPDLLVRGEIGKMIKDAEAERKAIYDDLTKESKDFEAKVKEIEIERQNALNESVTESMRDAANAIANKQIEQAYVEHLKKIYPEITKVLTDINSVTRRELKIYREVIARELKSTTDVVKQAELGKIIDKIDNELQKVDANPLKQIADSFKAIKESAEDADVAEELMKIGAAMGSIASTGRGMIADIQGASEDLGISLDNDFGDILDHIDQTLEGFEMMAEGIQMIGSGNPVAIIGGIVKVVSGLAKSVGNWFNNDKRKERQTQRIISQLRELESAYTDLEYAMNKALGEDKYTNQIDLIKNLQAQQQKLNEAIRKEEGKKKTDKGRVEGWREEIKEIDRQIDDLKDSIRVDLLGTDAKSFADKLSSVLVDAFKSGEDAAESLNKAVDELFENMVQRAIATRLEKEIGIIFDDIYNAMPKPGDGRRKGLTKEQVDEFKERLKGVGEIGASMEEMFGDIFTVDGDFNPETLKGAIQGMSQETADVLAGQFNAIRIDTASIVVVMTRNEERFIHALSFLAGIKNDTNNLNQMQIDLSQINDKMSSNDIRSSGL